MEGKHGENIRHPIPAGIFGAGVGRRKCKVLTEPAYFHGVFQEAWVVEPSIRVGGHPGGQMAYPVAVVESLSGTLRTVQIGDVFFEDWTEEVK